jgi:adenosine deaminase
VRDVATLPKAHLHVHLESALRWPTLREIAAANGIPVPDRFGREPGEGGDGSASTGFEEFFVHNGLVRDCLRKDEDFFRLAVEFCADEAAQGIRYAEVSFTAAAHGERLGDMDMPLAAVLRGLAEGQRRFGIECRVILDHSRRRPVERAWSTLRLAERYAADGVVAVGLAGDEAFPGDPFVEVFAAARAAGLHVVHHAGEAAGAGSIRKAITTGRAERIGHGIRVLENEDLVEEVRRRRIPLEVCPSSNVALGFVSSLDAHPLPLLRGAGLMVTLNTDIPAMTGTSLAAEYAGVRDTFGYGDDVLAEIARAGVEASFAPDATKARLDAAIDAWLGGP